MILWSLRTSNRGSACCIHVETNPEAYFGLFLHLIIWFRAPQQAFALALQPKVPFAAGPLSEAEARSTVNISKIKWP